MAFTPTQLPSGRWRSGYKLPGQSKVHRTFDTPEQATAWATTEEREQRALRAAPAVALDPLRAAAAHLRAAAALLDAAADGQVL